MNKDPLKIILGSVSYLYRISLFDIVALLNFVILETQTATTSDVFQEIQKACRCHLDTFTEDALSF